MPTRSSKDRDLTAAALRVAAPAIGEKPQETPPPGPYAGKNPAAVALGKLGGAKGGAARAKALSAEQRKKIAMQAALARWRAPKDQ
jgi:hypothetical protein